MQEIFSNIKNGEKSQILRILLGKYCMPTSVTTATIIWTMIFLYNVRKINSEVQRK